MFLGKGSLALIVIWNAFLFYTTLGRPPFHQTISSQPFCLTFHAWLTFFQLFQQLFNLLVLAPFDVRGL